MRARAAGRGATLDLHDELALDASEMPPRRHFFSRRKARLSAIGAGPVMVEAPVPGPFDTITAARRERDGIAGAKAKGKHVQPAPD
jgi:hypothetical protein